MVLAAGFGTRMLPITRFLPKALLPVAGRPLLEWNLLHLAANDVDEAVVNAHHLAEEMRRWEASLAGRVDEAFPRVRLMVEPEILGTGGGIANAALWLDSDPVVVVNADQLFRPDLAAARRTHEKGRFLATLLCVRDPRHAQVRADGACAIAIEPRPVFGDPGLLTFTGVYFLAREAVEAIVVAAASGGITSREDDGHSAVVPRSAVRAVVPRSAVRAVVPRSAVRGTHFLDVISVFRAWMAEGRLGVHLVEDEPFLEAGSPEAYLELLREATWMLSPTPMVPPMPQPRAAEAADIGNLSSSAPPASAFPIIHGFGVIEPGASVASDAWIEESAVLSGAIVEPGARVVRSILGPGAVARGELARRIVAGTQSLPIRLLLAPEEEALAQFLVRSWPVATIAALTGSIIEAAFSKHPPNGGVSMRLLQGDGSARRIVRAVRGSGSRILVLPAALDPGAASIYPQREGSGTPDEAAAFAYVSAHLERLGVPVPRIWAFDSESRVLLLEDLGDTHLYDAVRTARAAAPGHAHDGNAAPSGGNATLCGASVTALRGTYDEALEILLRMQAPPPEPFDPARTANPVYDEVFILRFEAGYFLREMVRGHCGIEPTDPVGLEADCARAAHEALFETPAVFMHRDYQSRNLMRTPRGLVVIDFQGARLGPPEYDLAALVLDPYADLPETLRSDLVERYLDRATRTPGERAAARRRFRANGINRMLQTLGAFGYLGGRLGKPGFLEHAPAALSRLGELAKDEYPHLEALAGQVCRADDGTRRAGRGAREEAMNERGRQETPGRRVLVTGASGLLGSSLVPFLAAAGHEVLCLTRPHTTIPAGRSPGPSSTPIVIGPRISQSAATLTWDPAVGVLDPRSIEGLDAVIHLAGEGIATGRWTPDIKDRILRSRVVGTHLLAERLASLTRKPEVLICASAVGFYGDGGDKMTDETHGQGAGFLASVVQAWEEAADPARAAGIRVVHLRLGVVLTPRGGALGRMLPTFRRGLGARLGSGRQYFSWIAIDDLLRVFGWVLAERPLFGPVNATATGPVTNVAFTRTLGRVLGRPAPFAVPAWVLRLALGEMAEETLLTGTRVRPTRLLTSGFTFDYPELEPALRHLLGKIDG
jgi:uncharacterized protein (TIGR01777 family)